jgi:hypothetical protein
VDRDQPSVSRDAPLIRRMLTEIEGLRGRIEQKEKEYRAIGGKENL